MRILFVCPYLPTPLKRRQLNFVLHLARRHELHLRVVATAGEMRAGPVAPSIVDHLRSSCTSLDVLPVALPELLARGAASYARGDALRTAYTRAHERWAERLKRDCESHRIDVVHVDRLRLARLASRIERPVVVDLPDCMSWAVGQWASVAHGVRRLFYREEARRLRRFEGGVLNGCPAAIVASEEDGRRVRASGYRGEAHCVPGIIDLLGEGDGGAPISSEAPSLTFHGNLFYPPNVDAIGRFVRDVFPALRAEIPSLTLTIVGARPGRRVRALASRDGVRVVGDVEAIGPWLCGATAVIAPMHIGAGHSQKVCEGLLAARPVICTPAVAERVEGEVRSRLLTATQPADWTRHIRGLVDDPTGADELGREGRAAVLASYSAEAIIPRLESVYRRVVQAGATRTA